MRKLSAKRTSVDRRALLLGAASLAAPALARAQAPSHESSKGSWPSKPIRFVVPYGPGGATDIVMRILTPRLSDRLGQPCVVENRAGAGGVVGTDNVAKSTDGHSFAHCS